MKEKLDLSKPESFNQKIQWLKLYDRNIEYITMADKFLVKEYVSKRVGEKYVIPTLGHWEHFDDIDFSKLPTKFVLKASHGSGNNDVVICKDKYNFDYQSARKKLESSLRQNCYYSTAEWQYKKIQPCIIAEEYLENEDGTLPDYKFMCFNGTVKCLFVCTDRDTGDGLKITFFDENFQRLPFERDHPSDNRIILKPKCYNKMKVLAEILSKNIPFVRVDLYEVRGNVFFGEFTFHPGSGYEKFQPTDWDYKLGSWLELPKEMHYVR